MDLSSADTAAPPKAQNKKSKGQMISLAMPARL